MLELLFLILGLLGLVVGAHLIIKGALNIAEHYKISQFFIGLTILAIGTDLPELVVIITAAIHRLGGIETSGLVIGGTLGTGFGQIALTLGLLGLFTVLILTKRQLIRDGTMLIGSVALLFLIGLDGKISRPEGITFIFIYLIYFLFLYREEKVREKIKRAPTMHFAWSLLSLVVGFAVLIYCSDIVIKNAVGLAESWGIKQSLIGVLIVGLGTSLPEIVISLSALRKKAIGLSVGNLIGSNIFDVLFALGIGSAISGFLVSNEFLRFDIPFLFVASIIVILFFTRDKRIKRTEAIVLILIYLAYIGSKLMGL